MRLDRLHMLILILFLPDRNTFASINKRIVLTQPTVILVSYDGFRWDYMEKVHTPNLNFIASNGIKAKHLLNTFVTKTFPNHFTLVTGLYEESYGIVANTFFDPVFNDTFYVRRLCRSITWIQNGGTENRCGSRSKKLLRKVLWCFGLVQK